MKGVGTYKDVGNAAATILGAPSIRGLDVKAENASSVTAKTRHGSYLTAQWVNGESWGVFSAENLITYLCVHALVRVFRLWVINPVTSSFFSRDLH